MAGAAVLVLAAGSDSSGIKNAELDLRYDQYCDIMAGDKQFYHPQVLTFWDKTVPPDDKRATDFYFKYPLQESCVTSIDLPAGFEVASLPSNQHISFTYSSFDITYVYDAAKNQVVSTTKFILNDHIIPAGKYAGLQQYLDAVAKAQNKKLVIQRKA